MQKRISVRIILLSVLGLLIGITVAYYNTASLGYDNANIFTLYNDSVKIFDIVINFEDISRIISTLKRIVPKVFISI